MAEKIISDEMVYLQTLSGNVTIRKADGTEFTMPTATQLYNNGGVEYDLSKVGKTYGKNTKVSVFSYKLPADIGNGPITVIYKTQIISADEAKQ